MREWTREGRTIEVSNKVRSLISLRLSSLFGSTVFVFFLSFFFPSKDKTVPTPIPLSEHVTV